MPADCIKILISNGFKPALVIETEETMFSSLKSTGRQHGIPYHQLPKNEVTTLLNSLSDPTIIFSINNNYIYSSKMIRRENVRVINFHNAYLPNYRGHGKVVPTWAIFNGELTHGVTWHMVSDGIDEGRILCQEAFEISEDDTALHLITRCISLGINLFSNNLDKFSNDQTIGKSQIKNSSKIYRSKDIPNDGWLNINWGFDMISRFLRSMDTGLFNLLSKPKIRLYDKNFLISKYTIDKQTNKNRERFMEIDKENMKQVKFEFQRGIITLKLKQEH